MVSPEAFIKALGELLSIQLSRPILCNVPKSIIEHPDPVSIIAWVFSFWSFAAASTVQGSSVELASAEEASHWYFGYTEFQLSWPRWPHAWQNLVGQLATKWSVL